MCRRYMYIPIRIYAQRASRDLLCMGLMYRTSDGGESLESGGPEEREETRDFLSIPTTPGKRERVDLRGVARVRLSEGKGAVASSLKLKFSRC